MQRLDTIEKKRQGSPEFPIHYYHVNQDHPRYVMTAHWHQEFEIIRVLEGEFALRLDNVDYLLKAGEVALVGCGCMHAGKGEGCVYECAVFNLNMLLHSRQDAVEKYLTPILDARVKVEPILCRDHEEVLVAVEGIFSSLSSQQAYYELAVYSRLFDLFSKLYTRGYILPQAKSQRTRQAQTMAGLIAWIEKNFTEPISLEELCRRSGYSKKYLCRVFKDYTAKTVVGYINELRIEKACYDMAEKGKSVTAAALDSGFNELSYFCKLFKRYKGVTPTEFVKSSL